MGRVHVLFENGTHGWREADKITLRQFMLTNYGVDIDKVQFITQQQYHAFQKHRTGIVATVFSLGLSVGSLAAGVAAVPGVLVPVHGIIKGLKDVRKGEVYPANQIIADGVKPEGCRVGDSCYRSADWGEALDSMCCDGNSLFAS